MSQRFNPARGIGGSLLPSSDARILKPLGNLQVRALTELDAHGLFYEGSLLATHPNGYSCRELAERMVAGDERRVREQAQFILDCGGTTRHLDHIVNAMHDVGEV